jgi:hypothetical protein
MNETKYIRLDSSKVWSTQILREPIQPTHSLAAIAEMCDASRHSPTNESAFVCRCTRKCSR